MLAVQRIKLPEQFLRREPSAHRGVGSCLKALAHVTRSAKWLQHDDWYAEPVGTLLATQQEPLIGVIGKVKEQDIRDIVSEQRSCAPGSFNHICPA